MKSAANKAPFEIYNESELITRIEGHDEFRPSKASIVFVQQGEMSFQVNGIDKRYRECDIVIISPRNIYRLKTISEDIRIFITSINFNAYQRLQFNFNRFDIYKIIAIENNNAISVSEEDFKYMLSILKNIYYQTHTKEDSKYRNEVLLHMFGALIYMIVNQLEPLIYSDSKILNTRKEELTFSFMELASRDYATEKELKYYADKLCVSIKYMSICVKEVTGQPPSYFLTRLILEEARTRLSDKHQTIATIANDLNFSDSYSFSKFFKKNTGVSPSVFKKELIQIHTI